MQVKSDGFLRNTLALRRMAVAAGVVVLATALGGTSALARPDLRKMTCAQAQAMVKHNGTVVFTTSNTTFSLFVSNRRYCDAWEIVRLQYGPTRDNPKCPVAYECFEPLFKRGGLFRD